jgi:hypothetical protein
MNLDGCANDLTGDLVRACGPGDGYDLLIHVASLWSLVGIGCDACHVRAKAFNRDGYDLLIHVASLRSLGEICCNT